MPIIEQKIVKVLLENTILRPHPWNFWGNPIEVNQSHDILLLKTGKTDPKTIQGLNCDKKFNTGRVW